MSFNLFRERDRLFSAHQMKSLQHRVYYLTDVSGLSAAITSMMSRHFFTNTPGLSSFRLASPRVIMIETPTTMTSSSTYSTTTCPDCQEILWPFWDFFLKKPHEFTKTVLSCPKAERSFINYRNFLHFILLFHTSNDRKTSFAAQNRVETGRLGQKNSSNAWDLRYF